MGEIIPSESLSHVTYIGINSMHSQKTKQSYIRSTRQNRTRKKKRRRKKKKRKKKKKSAGEEWALRKSKINRITKERKALEQPPPPPPRKKRTKYIKLLRTEPLKTGRLKNKPELKKLATERIRALQTAQKTTTQEKSWMEDGSEKTAWKSRT